MISCANRIVRRDPGVKLRFVLKYCFRDVLDSPYDLKNGRISLRVSSLRYAGRSIEINENDA